VPEFKVKVELTCKTCGGKFYSTIPDEIHIQPEIPNVKPITITIEEMKGAVKKDIKDASDKIIGSADAKDFTFDINHPKCNSNNKYSVMDCTFLPS